MDTGKRISRYFRAMPGGWGRYERELDHPKVACQQRFPYYRYHLHSHSLSTDVLGGNSVASMFSSSFLTLLTEEV